MARNLELEKEIIDVCRDVYFYMRNENSIFPKIFSKQGGSSACYRKSEHAIYFRWNVWNKLCMAGKKMLVIHEMYHALGNCHKGAKLYTHQFDVLTIEIYKRIYGEDKYYKKMIERIKELI